MTLESLADSCNIEIKLFRFPSKPHRQGRDWCAYLEGCAVRLSPDRPQVWLFGQGLDPLDALIDYAHLLAGHTLVVHPSRPELRREVDVPADLSVS